MPFVQKKLVPPKESDKHEYDENLDENDIDEDEDIKSRINNSHSEHEEFLHPNLIKEKDEVEEVRKSQMTKS